MESAKDLTHGRDAVASLTFVIRGDPTVTIVRPRGGLSLPSVTALRGAMQKCLADQPAGIVVDMSELTVIDDVCLTVFAAVARQATAWPGCALVLGGASPAVTDRLRAPAIDRQVSVQPTLADAIGVAAGHPVSPNA